MRLAERQKSVYIWDPNPFNPYGTEIARVISNSVGFNVVHYTRRNRPYHADRATTLGVLPPGAAGKRSGAHAVNYLLGLIRFAGVCIRRRPVVVFPWILNRWEALVARLLGKCGLSTVIVVHNPIQERDEVKRIKGLQKARETATKLVVHTEELRSGLDGQVVVAAHPSYLAWKKAISRRKIDTNIDISIANLPSRTVLFAGAIRKDKGFSLLPDLAEELHKKDIHLMVCVGIYAESEMSTLRALPNVTIVGDGLSYLSDETLYTALLRTGAIVAPYKNVTVSGTVLLALTMDVPIVGFECPEFSRIVSSDFLAPQGSVSELAAVAESVLNGSYHGNRFASIQDETSRLDWETLLSQV